MIDRIDPDDIAIGSPTSFWAERLSGRRWWIRIERSTGGAMVIILTATVGRPDGPPWQLGEWLGSCVRLGALVEVEPP